jgi:formate dehydrogenase maturation protein FdhE
MPKPMTNKEYLSHSGNKCPFCGSHNISGREVQTDCDYAWRKVDCNDCDKEWTENFKMTGYEAP